MRMMKEGRAGLFHRLREGPHSLNPMVRIFHPPFVSTEEFFHTRYEEDGRVF